MPQVRIGWASRDISTDKPVNLPGQFHARISQGILDPVTATALAVDNGEDSVIFLSCDQGSLRHHILEIVREKVKAADPSVPVDKIIINCTHTHTAPDYAPESKTEENKTISSRLRDIPTDLVLASSQEYQDFFFRQCTDAILEAWQKRKNGGIAYGYGYAVVAHSRRVVYMDDVSTRPGAQNRPGIAVNGHAVMYGNTNDDQFSGYEAGADHFINLLYTFDENKKLTGAILNVPCPSQNTECYCKVSASYWHEVRRNIRAKYGDIFLLSQCAAAGDLSPRILHYKQAQARRFQLKYGRAEKFDEEFAREDIAERIAEAFDEVYSWAKKDIQTDLTIAHEKKILDLPKRIVTDEEVKVENDAVAELNRQTWATEGTSEEKFRHDTILSAQRVRCQAMISRYNEQKTEPTLASEVHVLHIGDVAFATCQFEYYMDYQHRIQARSPYTQTFFVQLCGTIGGHGGTYLPTERGAANKGYSASRYCNLVTPAAGQMIVENAVATLKKFKESEEK